MKALELRSYDGAPSSLVLAPRPLPRLGPGEVLVKIHAAPINPSDLGFIRGSYVRKDLPVVAGFEGSGVVVATGGGFGARALLGRRVACAAPPDGDGTWAEYMATPASSCVPLLPSVELDAGATLFINPMTAWGLLDVAAHDGHEALAQTAAASALGRMLVRLTIERKIPMVHVVRRPAQVSLLRSLGAEHVLDSSEPDFQDRLHEAFRRLNVTLAFDAVAGSMTRHLVAALPRGGGVLVYGNLSEQPAEVNPSDLIIDDKYVEGFSLATWRRNTTFAQIARLGLWVQRRVDREFRTEVRARYVLEDFQKALDEYKASMTMGKVLLTP